MTRKILRLLKIESSKLKGHFDKVADVLFLIAFVFLFIWLTAVWQVYKGDTTKLTTYATFGTGLGTALLSLVTFFMARSTSRMVRETRLDRQRLYITEFIGLVIDPLIEVVRKHEKTVSRRDFEWT